MIKLVVIRHAHSFGNKFGFRQGHVDFPLSPQGIEEASHLTSALPADVDEVYSSDLRRASETVEFSEFDGEHYTTELLREHDFGRLSGVSVSGTDDRLPYSLDTDERLAADEPWPEGESFNDLIERVRGFCRVLSAEHSDDEVIGVVTHQGVIHAFQEIAEDDSVDEYSKASNLSGRVFKLEVEDEEFTIEQIDSIETEL